MKSIKVDYLRELRWFTFCWCFSLEEGIFISAAIFTTLISLTLVLLVSTILQSIGPVGLIGLSFVLGHSLLILAGVYLALFGVYQEIPSLIKQATLSLLFALIEYLVVSVLSYIPATYRYACIMHRCPDLLWMGDSFWRSYYFENYSRLYIEGEYSETDYDDLALLKDFDIICTWRRPIKTTKASGVIPEVSNERPNALFETKDASFKTMNRSGEIPQVSNKTMNQTVEKPKLSNETMKESLKTSKESIETTHSYGKMLIKINYSTKAINYYVDSPERASNGIVSELLSDDPRVKVPLRNPAGALYASVILNMAYTAFLIYNILTYIAYTNEFNISKERIRDLKDKSYIYAPKFKVKIKHEEGVTDLSEKQEKKNSLDAEIASTDLAHVAHSYNPTFQLNSDMRNQDDSEF